jgi:hypothetical protein
MSIEKPMLSAYSKKNPKEDHLDKLKLLEDALSRLTILEHPLEISNICRSIIDIKKNLEEKS